MAISRVWLIACQYLYTFGLPCLMLVLQIYNRVWNCAAPPSDFDFSQTGNDLSLKVKEVLSKPLLVCQAHHTWLNFINFWHFLSLSAVSAFALFYYRRYKEAINI